MDTTVFLVRHGESEWSRERRLASHRDVGLSAAGQRQAERAARALAAVALTELVTSPQLRALQTAEAIATACGVEPSRDPRLCDLRAGRWEGLGYDEISATPEHARLVEDPAGARAPDGEGLVEVRLRAAAAVVQAMADNPGGARIALVTHAAVARLLLAHYLGLPIGAAGRLGVSPGGISVLRFGDDAAPPRVLALNCGGELEHALR